MSIIAAGTTTTTALSSTGNTDGTLQLQVNGTTPSVTLNTLGAVGVGSTPAFGTAGQVLTSGGSTVAPTWTTIGSSQWTTTGSDIYYNTGNVGVGTSSPSQKLDATVSSSTEGSGLAVTNSLTGGYGSGVTFYSLRSDTSAKVAAGAVGMEGASSWNSNATTSSSMVFKTINANTLAERFRIGSAGQLGIGGATYGTSGQVLTSGGSGAAPSWTTVSGIGAATPTAIGTVYGKTDTSNNAFIGYQAGNSGSGQYNAYVGFQAGYATASGSNTFVGYQAGFTSGTTQAVGVGYQALKSGTDQNYALGYQAGSTTTSGYNNIYIGHTTGNGHTTGAYGTYMGHAAIPSANNVSGEMVICSGYNGGSTTGKGADTGFIKPSNGNIYNGANSSSWSTTSDQRLKKNIVDNNVGLDKITSIRVRNFEYRVAEEVTELPKNQTIEKTGVQLGVIAQELQAVLPNCVKQESTGVLSVDTDNLTWYMINAIKELKAEIDQLKGNV
jgi:hypothetical protein